MAYLLCGATAKSSHTDLNMVKNDDKQTLPFLKIGTSEKKFLPQDPLFKEVFTNKEFIKSLLTELLPIKSLDTLDFSKMELMSSNFVRDSLDIKKLRELYNDLLWRIEWREGSYTYLCLLLEMQSKPDISMAKRIGDYILGLYGHLEIGGKIKARQRYPFVLPVVIYNGERRWNVPLDLGELIADVPKDLEYLRINLPYELIDIRHFRQDLLKDGVSSWFIRLLNSEGSDDFKKAVKRLQQLLSRKDQMPIHKILTFLISYLKEQKNFEAQDGMDVLDEVGENTMEDDWVVAWYKRIEKGDKAKEAKLKAQCMAEGRAEGRAAGMAEGREEGRAEGRAEGEAIGEKRGKVEGILHATLANLKNLVTWRYGSVPSEVEGCLDAKKKDLSFLEQAMKLVLDCPNLEDFKKKLKEYDGSVSAV